MDFHIFQDGYCTTNQLHIFPPKCWGKIVGIRPKIYLANDGNYREMRWFTPWYIDPSKQGASSWRADVFFVLVCDRKMW